MSGQFKEQHESVDLRVITCSETNLAYVSIDDLISWAMTFGPQEWTSEQLVRKFNQMRQKSFAKMQEMEE